MTANDAITSFAWSDLFIMGYGPMDDEHREFVAVVRAMLTCTDAQMAARLEDFAVHANAHFGAEDRWMTETDFPARECHIQEHAAVMQSLTEVRDAVARGDIAVGRRFAEELARWFPGHADYLDSALSHWMNKRRLGGKPIVLRRGVASGA